MNQKRSNSIQNKNDVQRKFLYTEKLRLEEEERKKKEEEEIKKLQSG